MSPRKTPLGLALGVLACAALLSGCGSDVGGAACDQEGQPCEGGGVCTGGVCVVVDAGGGDADGGGGPPPVDIWGEGDVPAPPDVPPQDVGPGPDVPRFDTIAPDLIPDRTPPFVVSFEPADGESNVPVEFVVRIEFDGPVRPTTIIKGDTFSVTDVERREVAGTVELGPDPAAPTTIVFRPTVAVLHGSPYRVELTPSIMDLAGTRMAEFLRWRFFTEPLPAPADHTAVALRYAPHIRQQTQAPNPEYEYVTRFDLDGDWDLTNSLAAIRAADAVPGVVYYAVVETKSHWFVSYLYYHPYRDVGGGASYANDLAGAQVVVQRYPVERPLLVQLWFQTGTQQDVLAYVTSESGLTGAYIDGTWPAAQLFPDGHYPAWLTARSHQSCLWLDRDNGFPRPCRLSDADLPMITHVEYVPPAVAGGGGEALIEANGGFPLTTGDDPIEYVLEDVLVDLWPRRLDVQPGGVVFAESFAFASHDDRTLGARPGAGTRLGSRFVAAASAAGYGLAPWAIDWRPSAGQFVVLEAGTLFLDPAYFLKKRFPSLTDWDAATRTGFSLDYCYHPYLNINRRPTDAQCAVAP
jgi:hypothetical protein